VNARGAEDGEGAGAGLVLFTYDGGKSFTERPVAEHVSMNRQNVDMSRRRVDQIDIGMTCLK
jgi:hypothetical protein